MNAETQINNDMEAKWLAKVMVANNHHAFTQLVKLHQSQVRNYARRLAKGDITLADDLAQETFVIAYEKIQSFKNEGSFAGWLLKICYHQFLAYLRRNKFEYTDEEPEIEIKDEVETELMLLKAMSVLSPEERSAVTLHCSLGHSHGEIVDIMKIPLGTVKSHINRGKIKLSEYIQQTINIENKGAA